MTRRGLARLLLAALLGTASASAPVLAQSGEVTLQFPMWQAEEAGFGDWWRAVTSAYEKSTPNVKIKIEQISYQNYANEMTIRFASNRPPDIVLLPSNAFGGFASQGWLEPLDSRLQGTPIQGKDWSSLQQHYRWDGKTLGVLVMGFGTMLFYNEALLNAAGTPVPKDFASYTAAVEKITNRDKGVFGLAAVTSEYPTIIYDIMGFLEWQGQKFIDNGKYNLTNPKVIAALESYRRVVGNNAPIGSNHTVARQLFLDGKTGFLLDGPWVWARIGSAPAAVRPSLKMVALPFEPHIGGAANSLHIPVGISAERKDLVWSFIKFAMQPEWQRRYLLSTSAPPGLGNVLTEEDRKANAHLAEVAESARGAISATPTVQSVQANVNEFGTIVQRLAVRVISTKDPIDRIAKETQAELERTIPLN